MSASGEHADRAVLVLEDGTVHVGEAWGAAGAALGEAVFQTGMTGYQETLTDPSYRRQIVVATAPHVGNTGWNDEDDESGRIQVAGFVVRDPARRPSSWRSSRSLDTELTRQGIVGLAGVDTRAVTRRLREVGSMRAGLFSGDALSSTESMLAHVRAQPAMAGADLAGEVSTADPYTVPAAGVRRCTVAALDLGIKANTPRMLARRGIETRVLPSSSTIDQLLGAGEGGRRPDGVFLSNGPGDPATADHAVALTAEVLRRGVPLLGICFGNQILARALGLETYKLRYGHRGINVPVVDHATGMVAITSQNHGFAVAGEPGARVTSPFGEVHLSHSCPNDGVVEGLTCAEVPAFSVQYHPEAAAGPHDAADLFDRFADLMVKH